jgi:hydroxyethylthiazole kinase
MPDLLNPAHVAHLRHLLRAIPPCSLHDQRRGADLYRQRSAGVGASPAMVIDPDEASQFAAIADALLINVGTLTEDRAVAMRAAVERAAGRQTLDAGSGGGRRPDRAHGLLS